jgi:hypothetical protein
VVEEAMGQNHDVAGASGLHHEVGGLFGPRFGLSAGFLALVVAEIPPADPRQETPGRGRKANPAR